MAVIMDEKKRIVFIANPISGTQNKKQVLQCIKERIDQSKYDCEMMLTEYAGHAIELAAKAADEGVSIVVAVGGDGTINEIARSLRFGQWIGPAFTESVGSKGSYRCD